MIEWKKYILYLVPLTVFLAVFIISCFYNAGLFNINPINGGDILQTVALVATLFVMRHSNKQQKEHFERQFQEQRQQWLNDGYRKAEIENWLEYKKRFYDLTCEFKLFIKYLFCGDTLFKENPVDYFERLQKDSFELYKMHLFLKCCIQKESKLDFDKTKNLLILVREFYRELVNRYEKMNIMKNEEGWVIFDFKNAVDNIILSTSVDFDLLRDKQQSERIFKEFKTTSLIEVYINEIDQINEVLNEITIPKEMIK